MPAICELEIMLENLITIVLCVMLDRHAKQTRRAEYV